jgi:hypothetical protein
MTYIEQGLIRMKMPLTTFTYLLLGLSFTHISQAQTQARDIALQVFNRDDGRSQISLQTLTTCQYEIKTRDNNTKQRQCIEKPRSKTIESVRKDYGKDEKDKKSVSILTAPPSERGIGFLQYDYEAQDKDADQWMYLSALGKAKRIVSGNDDEPKTGSFFGSEFSYEDMEAPHIDDYSYKILKETNYRNRPVWILEITPTPSRARKSNYSRSINWIDKERLLQLKSIVYDRQGRKHKRISASDIRLIDGIWMPMTLSIDNLQSKRVTTLNIEKTALNIKVSDEFLSLRTLTDAAFREQNLRAYREAF